MYSPSTSVGKGAMEMDIHQGSILQSFGPVAVSAPGDLNSPSRGLATWEMETGQQRIWMSSQC